MYDRIIVTEVAGIATITLNRPAQRNALDRVMRQELTAALLAAHDTARVIVLAGAGDAFCSGQDLRDVDADGGFDITATLNDEYVPMLRAIVDAPVPVIAAVGGVAAGAGANLALACDVVIASENASFIQAFTRIGLIPDAGGTWVLPRLVGSARAMGAMLFAEPVSARRALEWGMIWECVPADSLDTHVAARAAAIARGPALAQRALKRALKASAVNDLAAQLALEAELQGACGADPDFAEGIAAFRQKRPPVFGEG